MGETSTAAHDIAQEEMFKAGDRLASLRAAIEKLRDIYAFAEIIEAEDPR